MPRIISIARISPTRSSRVRCWVTSAGTSAGSVSVAMWRVSSSRWSGRSGISGRARSGRARGISAASRLTLAARVPAASATARWMAAPRSEEEATPQVERLWPGRLRWRLRGAWQWPTFLALTLLDGVLLQLLPPYGSGPGGLVPAILLAGFANLLLVAVVGPLIGRRVLRWRRPDLPRPIADDYAGTALMCALTVALTL